MPFKEIVIYWELGRMDFALENSKIYRNLRLFAQCCHAANAFFFGPGSMFSSGHPPLSKCKSYSIHKRSPVDKKM